MEQNVPGFPVETWFNIGSLDLLSLCNLLSVNRYLANVALEAFRKRYAAYLESELGVLYGCVRNDEADDST
jgi:hypothetical protein